MQRLTPRSGPTLPDPRQGSQASAGAVVAEGARVIRQATSRSRAGPAARWPRAAADADRAYQEPLAVAEVFEAHAAQSRRHKAPAG